LGAVRFPQAVLAEHILASGVAKVASQAQKSSSLDARLNGQEGYLLLLVVVLQAQHRVRVIFRLQMVACRVPAVLLSLVVVAVTMAMLVHWN
jgi:hypothetical protein